MEALVFRGTRQLAIEEVPSPEPGAQEALIEVACCGICGSDLHGYLGHSARRTRSIPLVMGHEFSGRIAALGPECGSALRVGQRVTVQPVICCGSCPACRSGRSHLCPTMSLIGIERPGAFAPLVSVPCDRLFPIPDSLPDSSAALAETLAVEVHLFRQMAPSLLRNVLILGAGAQGLLALQLAKLLNVPEIIVSDVVPARLEIARSLGATTVVDARTDSPAATARELTGGWGVELAVETSGVPAVRTEGAAAVAPGGTLGLIGLGVGPSTIDFLPVVSREISLRGSYCYSDDDFGRSLELLAIGQVAAEPLVTVRPLGCGPESFASLIDDPGAAVKVLLQPGASAA